MTEQATDSFLGNWAAKKIEELQAELATVTAERDELVDAFTVLWVSQERSQWDTNAIEEFDLLLAKVGAGKTEE